QRLFGLSPQTPLHNAINFYVSEEELCKLVIDISKGKYIDFEDIPTHEFSTGSGQYLMARGQPVLGEKNECLGAVVTFMDITAMKVLDRLKSEFVAKVSHELRSPLSTIHEQLGVVLRDAMEEESQRDQYLLTRAQEKTQSLISMIGDLLDLSRIESKSAKMDLKPIQLEDLLKSVVDFLDVRVKAKNQTLTLKLSETKLSELTTDPMALESIFGNLITNAINYTQDGGRIQVTASQAMDKILVSVEDNGFGIDAKYLDQIFEKFYRVKNENTRFITGTGLGLPIVKGLVDSLGGTITVESTPGMGSTFTVMLPVNR
ncbi:MAG: HAMP domain-containing histidine kinase, partial [Proteobacteria bacterium]|nr:HAMP domain-containing histidine kinase [Pseudomonadota bacterium]